MIESAKHCKKQYYEHKADKCRRDKGRDKRQNTRQKTTDRQTGQTQTPCTHTHTHSYTHHTISFKLTRHFIQRCHNEGDGLFLWQFFLHLPNLLLPGITWNHKERWNNNNSLIQGSLPVHLVTLASDAKWMMYQLSPGLSRGRRKVKRLCVCVCACVSACICVLMWVCEHDCTCVCVCAKENEVWRVM